MVQDNAGNQIPVFQEIDFEFTIRLNSTFVAPGGDVMQEVMSVDGVNVCNFYSGGYTLEDGLLTLISVSEDDQDCDRASELTARIFKSVLFSFGIPSMLSIDTQSDVLTIVSGTNETLFFKVNQE